ncbi:MAG: DUF5682 family protein [Isosphaeraceae bacterium]|nr:DUF5682 family protein [Isosphaeraceae bacterium]
MAAPATKTATVHILGVRHHGPGSARSVRRALETLEPDIVLVEGPPDANDLIAWLSHAEMEPPVALLLYRPESPKEAVFYPFAAFSPEWEAIRYALERGVPVRFMDLPITHQLARDPAGPEPEVTPSVDEPVSPAVRLRIDPLQELAQAAGFDDGETWWEHVVEHRRDGADLFAAILEAMAAVREELNPPEDLRERRREAHMRQTIRAAQSQGHQKIAVICGAWHAPALSPDRWPAARDDAALLKGLPRTKVTAAWVPWTHGRLAYESGYGAGVASPGWYHHLWTAPDQVANRWMTRVARLLRDEGLDASSASIIEAVRLAEALASLRERPLPGLSELNEAARTVFCFGDETPMRLIARRLIVGEVLGRVPAETPTVPLQQDVTRLQKQLKLPPDPSQTTKVLDLREANDLERSRLLHRLNLLGIPWGHITHAGGKGTFKEAWQLQWLPDFAVGLIEASLWGLTVLDAATGKARDLSTKADDLPALTRLLDQALLADLHEAVAHIMERLESQAALAGDVLQLMDALPPLANLMRYGNVRKTDATLVGHVVVGMIARVCIGLPPACSSLDDAASEAMFESIRQADAAIQLMLDAEHLLAWRSTLAKLAESDRLHQLVAGRCCRILLDAHLIDASEAARRMNLAVSTASEPARAAAWVEGFLKGSGEMLYYDDALFGVFDAWLSSLHAETFPELLPLLRRTFATFEAPLRRNLGEKARDGAKGNADRAALPTAADFSAERAATALPVLAQLLGLAPVSESEGR